MKIINNKKEAIEELKRISTRTNSDNNNEINTIVDKILLFMHPLWPTSNQQKREYKLPKEID